MKHECGKPPRYLCVYCNYKSVYKHDVQKHARRKHPDYDNAVIELYNIANKSGTQMPEKPVYYHY